MKSFSPVILQSEDVMGDLLNTANRLGISADALDFDLLNYETYYKGTIDDEWQRLHGTDLLAETTEVEIRSNTFLLKQEYEIRIRPARPHPYLNLRFSIGTDKYKSKIVAIIDPKSDIPLKKGVQEWIKEAITRKKLRYGLLVGICEAGLDREIARLLVKLQKEGSLNAPYHLPIGSCYPPIPPTDDKILLHYKKARAGRSLIEGVMPGDLLLEYLFPKHGRDGRGCDGNHIAVPDPELKYAGYIVIDDETIVSEQDEESIRFYANTSGYIQRKKGVFSIAQELSLETASFRQTGSIEAGIDKEISVKVRKKDATEDAVGTGVNIDVQKLDVSGTVGSHAKIQACEVNIGSQTHKHAQINVTEVANIHLHRGNLKAKEANIDILETGKVEADIVRIQKMVGGEVIAHKIYVDTLYSNAKITALELIEIKTIVGEGNKLTIDPLSIENYHEKIRLLEADIRTKTSHLQEQAKIYIAREISFKNKNSRIKQIQERVLDTKRSGNEPMKADIIRLQQYKSEAEAMKTFSTQLQAAEETIRILQEQCNHLYEADLHAVITHHGTYNGKTRITFVDPKTKGHYATTPEGQITHIRLRQEGDNKRIIYES